MIKVLILGVSNAQVDALRYLKETNCITYGLSCSHKGRGIKFWDHFDVIDIKDKANANALAYAEKTKCSMYLFLSMWKSTTSRHIVN